MYKAIDPVVFVKPKTLATKFSIFNPLSMKSYRVSEYNRVVQSSALHYIRSICLYVPGSAFDISFADVVWAQQVI